MPGGFALLPEERMREIASLGGRASHAAGGAHKWDAEEAAAAGRKGGASVSADREHMARIGRLGGKKRGEILRAAKAAAAAAAARGAKGVA